jgi:hypothetical protein
MSAESNERGKKNPDADGRDAYFTAWKSKLNQDARVD